MKKGIKILIVITLFCKVAVGQITQAVPQKSSDPNETVIKYEEFLREETKNHREYTQEYYEMILKLLGGIGIVTGGVLAWLNWKSKEDIKKQVNDQFKETVKELLDVKLKEIDILIKDGKEKSAKQFEEIGKIILELSAKSNTISNKKQNSKEEEFDEGNLKGKRILWVDDVPSNNDYPRKTLEQAGVAFTLALNTKQAINILQNQSFDLIISDMGRGNNYAAGIELLTELKQLDIKTPAIIYASSRAINKYGDEALGLGAVTAITGVATLLNVVQNIFNSK